MNNQLSVIKIKGHQYKVKPGDIIETEKLEGKEGDIIDFKDVLLKIENKKVNLGTPLLENSVIKGKILKQYKGDKVEIVKFKKKRRYLKRQGHRQNYTRIEIQ